MKIAFYNPHITVRGVENTMFDFAYYNEKILGNKSIIIYGDNNAAPNFPHDLTAIERFKNNFEMFQTKSSQYNYGWTPTVVPLIDKILQDQKCDAIYMQKGGSNDGVISQVCPTLVLCASHIKDPHGSRYAYVSKWLSDHTSQGKLPWIPVIIDLPSMKDDLRVEYNIPANALVFGRNGGADSWSIPWVDDVILKTVQTNPNIYFIFQNTPISVTHPNIIHAKTTANIIYKAKFINTCDAMIHARSDGESFGMSVAEFSVKNKPIITHRRPTVSHNHILYLKEKGIYFDTPHELTSIFLNFIKRPYEDWNCYKDHTPLNGITKFKEVFLDGLERA